MAGSFLAPVANLRRRDIEELSRSIRPATQKIKQVRLRFPELWWANLSNLQKAIRRGNLWQAVESAERLYRHDPAKLRRRLAVVALEDVSFGDLRTVATVLQYTLDAPKEPCEADLGVCLALVEQMATTVKDRISAELIGASVDSPQSRDRVLTIAELSVRECVRRYTDEKADIRDRCAAGLALAGALKADDRRVGPRDRRALIDSLQSMRIPDAVNVIVKLALRLGSEPTALATTIPVLYSRIQTEDVSVVVSRLPDAVPIAGLLSPAYDRHTRTGLRALLKFRTQWQPLKEFLQMSLPNPAQAVATLAFRAEGSAVDRELRCAFGDEVFKMNEEAQSEAIGLPYVLLPMAKLLFLNGLPALNEFRRQAAEAELAVLRSSG